MHLSPWFAGWHGSHANIPNPHGILQVCVGCCFTHAIATERLFEKILGFSSYFRLHPEALHMIGFPDCCFKLYSLKVRAPRIVLRRFTTFGRMNIVCVALQALHASHSSHQQ